MLSADQLRNVPCIYSGVNFAFSMTTSVMWLTLHLVLLWLVGSANTTAQGHHPERSPSHASRLRTEGVLLSYVLTLNT